MVIDLTIFFPQKRLMVAFNLTAGYFLTNLLLHKRSCNLADFLLERWARARLDGYLFQVEYLLLIILTLFLGWFIVKGKRKRIDLLLSWGAVSIAAYIANRFLLVVHLEKIHYPQYGILAMLLLLWMKDTYSVLKITTYLGMVDELYQWYFLSTNRRNTYIDFNDMILNLLGGLMGILIVYSLKYLSEDHKKDYPELGAGFQSLMSKLTPQKIYQMVFLVLLTLSIPSWFSPSILTGVFQDLYQALLFSFQVGEGNFLITPSNGLSYHVLTPIEGGGSPYPFTHSK